MVKSKIQYQNDLIDVNRLLPLHKDIERAEGLLVLNKKKKGDGSPFRSNASKMAKLIQDPFKLVRRAKAISSMYGFGDFFPLPPGTEINQDSNVFSAFAIRLEEMGFSRKQISDIATWKLDPKIKARQIKMANIINRIKREKLEKEGNLK